MEQGRKQQWSKPMIGMINQQNALVDPYLPRKCEYTNKVITSRDRASVQINIANVDENGQKVKSATSVVLSGFIRATGQGSSALDRVLKEKGVLPIRN